MKCQYRHCNRILINVHGNSTHCNDDCTYAEKLLRQQDQYAKKKKLKKIMKEIKERLRKRKEQSLKNKYHE